MSFAPSPVAPNNMVKCCWTEERERALIAFYSGRKRTSEMDEGPSSRGQNRLWLTGMLCVSAEHRCLWNKRSSNHSNRQLRLGLLEVLSSQLSDAGVTVSGSEDRGQASV